MSLRPEWVELIRSLDAARVWITRPQPPDAVLDHHGMSNHVGGSMRVQIAPSGHLGPRRPDHNETAVLIFQCRAANLDEPKWPPFTADELAKLDELVAARFDVRDRWNGCPGGDSVSYLVGDVHPDLAAAVSRYHTGCPDHPRSLCWWDGCSWLSDHFSMIEPPAWVGVERAAEGSGGRDDADDDSNLRAVRETLARIAPILADYGVHAGTLAAGLRGHIEERPDGLEFVPDKGHGVLMPAELADRLVASLAELDALKS